MSAVSVEERKRLLKLAAEYNIDNDNIVYIRDKTKKEICSIMNISFATLQKSIRELESKGLLYKSKSTKTIAVWRGVVSE